MNVLTDAQMELMRRRLADAGIAGDQSATAAEPARSEPSDGGLGIAERRMWKIYELDPDSISHNYGVLLEFDASYTLEEVVASYQRLVDASEVLSSVITVGDDGVARRESKQWDGRWIVPGQVWEWGSMPASEESTEGRSPEQIVRAAATALSTASFRLRQDPPIRARAYARASGGVDMVLVLHHLAGDETALPPILSELVARADSAATAPSTPQAPARPVAALDRAVRHAVQTWAAEGIRYPLSGELPQTTPEQSWLSVMGEGPGAYLTRPIDESDVTALAGVAREVGATPNAVFIVVSALSIAALTGADDYVLLVPADNRQPGEAADKVGYCGNVVPMRFTFDPAASTKDALRAAVSTVYGSMEFSSVDYGPILTALRGDGRRFPVAEVMALVKNTPLRGVPIPGGAHVTCETVFKGVVHYPLALAFEIGEDERVRLEVEYRTDILDQPYAERAAKVVAELVARVPEALDSPLSDLFGALRAAADA
ncbi:condensation domain-containing protein [Nocardia cyriacigeorgica]|uniref:condensation domain-containing protein n=1 Tax=Nocardia cyriacigeorgica TaxID=135487 RepID=UPI002454AF4B|nr:condensation domain-containing protein [Nocardia cyriacigeorgica]